MIKFKADRNYANYEPANRKVLNFTHGTAHLSAQVS